MKNLFIGVVFLCFSSLCNAEQVTLAWGASTPQAEVAGYEIRYGQSSGLNTNVEDVGNVLTATITGLLSGKTYFFRARAYTSGKLIFSPDSNEVSKVFTIVLTAPINLQINAP